MRVTISTPANPFAKPAKDSRPVSNIISRRTTDLLEHSRRRDALQEWLDDCKHQVRVACTSWAPTIIIRMGHSPSVSLRHTRYAGS